MTVDGAESVAEFGRGLGLVGSYERTQEPVVDLGVEDREAQAVRGQCIPVPVRDAGDQLVAGQVWAHSDALPIDAPGHVPWWPRPNVKLFNIMVQIVGETNRHAGHADILREQLDGRVGESEQGSAAFQEYDADYWASKQAKIEQAAIAADPAQA